MSLLPPNSTATERAIEGATERGSGMAVPVDTLWNPATCPAPLLPWLAWALSVDIWDSQWSEARQRAVIAASVEVHRRKGTLGSIRRALEAAGYGTAIVRETWTYPRLGRTYVDAAEAPPFRNLWTEPEDFGAATWIKNSATVAANAVAAPDGSLTADTVTGTAAAENYMLRRALTGVVAGQDYGFSIHVRRANRDNVRLRLMGGASDVVVAANLATGAATGGTVQPVGGGWYRLSGAVTAAAHKNKVRGASAVENGTYWRQGPFTSGGVTFTVTPGVDPTDGLPIYDFTATGTPATAFLTPFVVDPRASATIPATQGQNVTASAIFRLIGGSLSGVLGMNLNIQELNGSGVRVGGGESAFVTASSDTVGLNARAVGSATAVRVITYPMLRVVVGTAINVAFRIKALQFEAGPTRTTYQHNFGEAASTDAVMPLVAALTVVPEGGSVGSVHAWGAQAELGAMTDYRPVPQRTLGRRWRLGPTGPHWANYEVEITEVIDRRAADALASRLAAVAPARCQLRRIYLSGVRHVLGRDLWALGNQVPLGGVYSYEVN